MENSKIDKVIVMEKLDQIQETEDELISSYCEQIVGQLIEQTPSVRSLVRSIASPRDDGQTTLWTVHHSLTIDPLALCSRTMR